MHPAPPVRAPRPGSCPPSLRSSQRRASARSCGSPQRPGDGGWGRGGERAWWIGGVRGQARGHAIKVDAGAMLGSRRLPRGLVACCAPAAVDDGPGWAHQVGRHTKKPYHTWVRHTTLHIMKPHLAVVEEDLAPAMRGRDRGGVAGAGACARSGGAGARAKQGGGRRRLWKTPRLASAGQGRWRAAWGGAAAGKHRAGRLQCAGGRPGS
jgi:hypothetical protein